MEHAFVVTIRAYYSINLTKDIVPGNMYQVINDQEYSLNEQFHKYWTKSALFHPIGRRQRINSDVLIQGEV